jgi:predicted TIM-barrel fold metal-dependent hydrolase
MPELFRIDVHHHALRSDTPASREAFLKSAPDFAWTLDWKPEDAIRTMDEGGCQTAINSQPGGAKHPDPAQAAHMAREMNDRGAKLVQDFPGRFGQFATLPLPHIDESLREMEYAVNVLNVDGFCLTSNFGDTWPGDPIYAPVMDELNRRKAVVFFHPAAPNACLSMVPGVPVHFIELPADTARCAVSLLYSGTLKRCPDIKFILAHGGGALPALSHRIASLAKARPSLLEIVPYGDPVRALGDFYFEITSALNPSAYGALRSLVQPSQLLFGTDCPFRTSAQEAAALDELNIDPAERLALEQTNAQRLFPRFAQAAAVTR